MIKKIIISAAILLAVVLCFTACKSDEAKSVNTLIKDIGTVSLSSEEAIKAAEDAYAALTDEQKAEVNRYEKLQQARAEYEKLVQIDIIDKAIEACKGAKDANDSALFWQNVLTADTAYKALADGDYNKDKYISFLKDTLLEYGISTLTAELEDSEDYSLLARERDVIVSALAAVGDSEGASYEGYKALKDGFTEVDRVIAEAQTAAKTYYKLFTNFYNKEEGVTVTSLGCKSEELNGKYYFVFAITYKNAEDKEKTLYANSIFGSQHTVETLASSYENYFKDTPASDNYDASVNGNIIIDLDAIINEAPVSEETTAAGEASTAAQTTVAAEETTATEGTTVAEETTAAEETTVTEETTAAQATTAAPQESTAAEAA